MATRSVAKDFHKLQKTIDSFSNGEARVVSFDDELTKFEVELNIKDGFYKDGVFSFEVLLNENYPKNAPDVRFNSQIYHPNIGDGFDDGIVCFNLLSEDWDANDLEDVVQGMLFLLKNPELKDALNPLFGYVDCVDENYMETFSELVRLSLEGGDVDGVRFQRNPGLVKKDKMMELKSTEHAPRIGQVTSETMGTTIKNDERAISQFSICWCNEEILPPELIINVSSEDMFSCGLFWVYENFINSSNDEKEISGRTCPTWLTKLAVLMFGDIENRKHNLNFFCRKLRTFERFYFCKRKLMWCK